MARISVGAVPSPNIWRHPTRYEVENAAADPEQRIEQAMRRIAAWDGATLLDLGCGTGYHLPRWAAQAGEVVGVEPHAGLTRLARRRCRGLQNVRVLQGAAQDIPLPDAVVDVVQIRWAYFFGPGCEPGLKELDRVIRRGGAAFVIDNDATRSTFGQWFRAARPEYEPSVVERFWSGHGWRREPLDIWWRFSSRRDLEDVVRIEFEPQHAERLLVDHRGLEVDYAVNLWWRRY
ncbi:MAG: class I SAM-dependent methyltransferase [Nocardioidaceae bacterium]|nr:class I SAM-dependent methyltransferase [Nocardioidaceae bacterium]